MPIETKELIQWLFFHNPQFNAKELKTVLDHLLAPVFDTDEAYAKAKQYKDFLRRKYSEKTKFAVNLSGFDPLEHFADCGIVAQTLKTLYEEEMAKSSKNRAKNWLINDSDDDNGDEHENDGYSSSTFQTPPRSATKSSPIRRLKSNGSGKKSDIYPQVYPRWTGPWEQGTLELGVSNLGINFFEVESFPLKDKTTDVLVVTKEQMGVSDAVTYGFELSPPLTLEGEELEAGRGIILTRHKVHAGFNSATSLDKWLNEAKIRNENLRYENFAEEVKRSVQKSAARSKGGVIRTLVLFPGDVVCTNDFFHASSKEKGPYHLHDSTTMFAFEHAPKFALTQAPVSNNRVQDQTPVNVIMLAIKGSDQALKKEERDDEALLNSRMAGLGIRS